MQTIRTRTFWGVLIAIFALKLALAASVPLTADESLHWMQGRHPAWGFSDHPPGTALLNAVGVRLFGHSAIGVRFFAVLSSVLVSVIARALLLELGAAAGPAAAGGLLLQLMPIFGIGSLLMTPFAPFASLVFAMVLFFYRFLRRQRVLDALLWGLFLGLAVLTYYVTVTAVAAIAVYCFVARDVRRLLFRPAFWLGAAAAAAVVAPHLLWCLRQGAESALHFQVAGRANPEFDIENVLAYIGATIGAGGPLLFPALAAAGSTMRGSRRDPGDRKRLFAACLVMVPLVFVLLMSCFRPAGAHWPLAAFLGAGPLLAMTRLEPPGRLRGWLRAAGVFLLVLIAAGLAILAVGPPRVVALIDPEFERMSVTARYRAFRLDDLAGRAQAWKEKLEADGGAITMATHGWSIAGLTSFHMPSHPTFLVVPGPTRHGQDYNRWTRRMEASDRILYLYQGTDLPAGHRAFFRACERLEGPASPGGFSLYLCRGLELDG